MRDFTPLSLVVLICKMGAIMTCPPHMQVPAVQTQEESCNSDSSDAANHCAV